MQKHYKVKKRDGSLADFDIAKVKNVLEIAMSNIYFNDFSQKIDKYVQEIIDNVETKFIDQLVINVEEIQNIVENTLMDNKEYDVVRKYIIYRKDKNIARDRLKYMKKYINSSENAATVSEEDSNSNVQCKNIANLNSETFKTYNRRLQRMWIKENLNKKFPEVARQYSEDLNSHIIYTHDESSFPAPTNYCEAVSLYPLLINGTSTMDGLKTTPPKNLDSFCGQLVNLTFLLSAQCKGAVAFGEFFNFFDYFCVKEFGKDWSSHLDDIIYDYNGVTRTVRWRIEQAFQQIIYSWNQPAGNRSYQSPFINISYYDENYWKAMFETFTFPDGSVPEWKNIDVLQRMFIKWFNAERKKTLLTFPVETLALLTDGTDVLDKEYKKLAARSWAEGHSFFLYLSDNPNALSSCCRLRNGLEKNVFSFTNGLSGVRTGSANVITLNINRIIQDIFGKTPNKSHDFFSQNKDQYIKLIRDGLIKILDRVYKYQMVYKDLLYKMENSGMLSATKAGYIDMRSLFLTIGINGLNEAAEYLGLECTDNENYKLFCRLITGTISEENRKHSGIKYKFNQEMVPAEQLGSRNCNWDREDGYWVPDGRILYNSYFYRADDTNISVLEKFRLHGKDYTELMDGGMGLHCNLDTNLSEAQYTKLIDYAIEKGTFYFTFNVPQTECLGCGNIEKIPVSACPKCGSDHVRQWTRVIGYLRPIDCFDNYRKQEAATRIFHNSII